MGGGNDLKYIRAYGLAFPIKTAPAVSRRPSKAGITGLRAGSLLERERKVLRRSGMTSRLLGRVRAREREVGRLVPNDAPQLRKCRPIREYPDHRRAVSREGALEAVPKAGGGRGYDGIDERDRCLRHIEFLTRLGQSHQSRIDIGRVRMGDSHLIRLDVHAESREEVETRKLVAADREGPVRRVDIELGDTDARLHRAQGLTADWTIVEA